MLRWCVESEDVEIEAVLHVTAGNQVRIDDTIPLFAWNCARDDAYSEQSMDCRRVLRRRVDSGKVDVG